MGSRIREDNGGEGVHEGRSYGGRGVGEADFYDDEISQRTGGSRTAPTRMTIGDARRGMACS